MVDQRLRIIVSALTGEARSEIKKLNNELAVAEKAAKENRAIFMAGASAVAGLGAAFLSQVPVLVEHGIEIERANRALEGYTGGAYQAEQATDAVKQAAQGMLSSFQATQSAARLFAMGLANTADEAATLTEMAITLGASMGKGPQEAFEEFTLLLANQSIPRLDTFGISGAQVRKRILELQAATGGLSREQAFLQAVMEQGNQKLNQLDEAGLEAGNSVDRLATMTEEYKEKVALFLADGLIPWIDGTFDLIDALKDQQDAFIANEEVSERWFVRSQIIAAMLGPLGRDITGLASATELLSLKYKELHSATEPVKEDFKVINEEVNGLPGKLNDLGQVSFSKAAGEAGELAGNIHNINFELSELTEKELARSMFDTLKMKLADPNLPPEMKDAIIEQMTEIGTSVFDLDPAFLNLSTWLQTANTDFLNNKTGLEEYLALLEDIENKISFFQSVGSIDIDFNFSDVPGGPPVGGGGGTPTGGGTTGGTGTTGLFE